MRLKYFKQYINENLKIGDNTNVGIIDDMTDTQYYINGSWYHKSIVKPSDIKPKLVNRGRIAPNMVISGFANSIDRNKVEEYYHIFIESGLDNDFPPIKGYPIIITEDDIDRYGVFLDDREITKSDIGKYAWIVTDGWHRTLAALKANIPYLETKIDFAYGDKEYHSEVNENTQEKQRISIDDLAKLIGKEFNINNVEFYAYGSNGLVYTFGKDKLLKITNSLNEAATSSILSGYNLKNITNIYNVRKFNEPKKYILDNSSKHKIRLPYFEDIYMIVVERLYDTKQAQDIIDDIYAVLNSEEKKVSASDIKLFKGLFKYFKSQVKNVKVNNSEDILIKCYEQIINIHDELKGFGIYPTDIHSGNFGFKENGNLAIFDIESKTKKSIINGVFDVDNF